MEWTCLEYEASLRGIWEKLALVCREQEQGDFPIPEITEGETGFLFLCKENDTILAALSAVTFDCSQFFFYPWCLPKGRQEIMPVLFRNFETRLLEDRCGPLQLSCYVNGFADCTIQMLKEQGYVCGDEEFIMHFDLSQYALRASPISSSVSVQYHPCSNQKTLQKLYQDIFRTSKKEAAFYMDSITEEPTAEFFTLSGAILCDPSNGSFPKNRKSLSKKRLLGMFGLIPHGNAVYLCSFGILPQYRRQGLGLAALQEICVALKERYSTIAIHVSGSNLPAMKLYRTFGFQVQKHIALYEKELV